LAIKLAKGHGSPPAGGQPVPPSEHWSLFVSQFELLKEIQPIFPDQAQPKTFSELPASAGFEYLLKTIKPAVKTTVIKKIGKMIFLNIVN
jgi:hypothetical protein